MCENHLEFKVSWNSAEPACPCVFRGCFCCVLMTETHALQSLSHLPSASLQKTLPFPALQQCFSVLELSGKV